MSSAGPELRPGAGGRQLLAFYVVVALVVGAVAGFAITTGESRDAETPIAGGYDVSGESPCLGAKFDVHAVGPLREPRQRRRDARRQARARGRPPHRRGELHRGGERRARGQGRRRGDRGDARRPPAGGRAQARPARAGLGAGGGHRTGSRATTSSARAPPASAASWRWRAVGVELELLAGERSAGEASYEDGLIEAQVDLPGGGERTLSGRRRRIAR